MREWILDKHPELSFLGERHLYFHNSVGEGQYFAIFRKQGNDLKREDVDTSKLSMLWEKKAKKIFLLSLFFKMLFIPTFASNRYCGFGGR